MSVKSSTEKCISKHCCQCASQLLRTNFKHSCDQVTFRLALSESYHNSDGLPNILSYQGLSYRLFFIYNKRSCCFSILDCLWSKNSYRMHQVLNQGDFCSFDQIKFSILLGYILPTYRKNLTTRKIMIT